MNSRLATIVLSTICVVVGSAIAAFFGIAMYFSKAYFSPANSTNAKDIAYVCSSAQAMVNVLSQPGIQAPELVIMARDNLKLSMVVCPISDHGAK